MEFSTRESQTKWNEPYSWDCCVLCWVRSLGVYTCFAGLCEMKTTQKQAKKKNKVETICVCWTMSFSFIAIIKELSYKTFENSLLLFIQKQGHTLDMCTRIFAKKTVHLILSVYRFQPYASSFARDKNKTSVDHWNISLNLTDCCLFSFEPKKKE